jgi:hypothetical protein
MPFPLHELEHAHDRYLQRSDRCAATGDWAPYGDQFTPDGLYVEHILGVYQGRDAIRTWITEAMGSWTPGTWSFPLEWRIFDEERGQVIFAAWNELIDPTGQGPFRFISWSLLDYAGDDMWSRQEDLYDSAAMTAALAGWVEATQEQK